MSLGLSHSLSRYKLKFSPDKVRWVDWWGPTQPPLCQAPGEGEE